MTEVLADPHAEQESISRVTEDSGDDSGSQKSKLSSKMSLERGCNTTKSQQCHSEGLELCCRFCLHGLNIHFLLESL